MKRPNRQNTAKATCARLPVQSETSHPEPSAPLIRDAVVQAAIQAGEGDLVAYLRRQADKHPSAFLTLLGKVLPTQVTGIDGEVIKTRIIFEIVDPERRQTSEN